MTLRRSAPPDVAAYADRKSGSGPWRFDVTGVRRRTCVLLVDDDDSARELFGWCLRAAGWQVEDAADGEQALLKAVGAEPDLIVLDLGMPRMDGTKVLRLLHGSAPLSFVPVVVCTACRDPAAAQLAREEGCAAFVTKPCSPEALRAVVEGVLGRAAAR
ncbi:MAG: response regulator [Polyangiaceae bacterium]